MSHQHQSSSPAPLEIRPSITATNRSAHPAACSNLEPAGDRPRAAAAGRGLSGSELGEPAAGQGLVPTGGQDID
jgi:hypothetical protein